MRLASQNSCRHTLFFEWDFLEQNSPVYVPLLCVHVKSKEKRNKGMSVAAAMLHNR